MMLHSVKHTSYIAKFYTNFTPWINIADKIAARNLRILVDSYKEQLFWIECIAICAHFITNMHVNWIPWMLVVHLCCLLYLLYHPLVVLWSFSWPFYWLSLPWCFKLTIESNRKSSILHSFRTSLSTGSSAVSTCMLCACGKSVCGPWARCCLCWGGGEKSFHSNKSFMQHS